MAHLDPYFSWIEIKLYMDLGSNFLGRGVRAHVHGHDEALVDAASSGGGVQAEQSVESPRLPKPICCGLRVTVALDR